MVAPLPDDNCNEMGTARTRTTATTTTTCSSVTKGRAAQRIIVEPEYPFPGPTLIQVIDQPRTIANHTYRDFSNVPPTLNQRNNYNNDNSNIMDIERMSFPRKLHYFVSNPKYIKAVQWRDHGRAFKFNLPTFCEPHCEAIFGCRRFPVLLTLMSSYGFKHITTGKDRNCFYHELFLRGKPYLTDYFPEPRNARRLIPDPSNEPNFYQINQKYPLPIDNDDHYHHHYDGGDTTTTTTIAN